MALIRITFATETYGETKYGRKTRKFLCAEPTDIGTKILPTFSPEAEKTSFEMFIDITGKDSKTDKVCNPAEILAGLLTSTKNKDSEDFGHHVFFEFTLHSFTQNEVWVDPDGVKPSRQSILINFDRSVVPQFSLSKPTQAGWNTVVRRPALV